jgi:hypothetical protein
MELTKTNIKRTIQSTNSAHGLGRGYRHFYSLRSGDGDRIRDAELDEVSENVEPGQIICVEALNRTPSGFTVDQAWIEYYIGESRIWAQRPAIKEEQLCEGLLVFERGE